MKQQHFRLKSIDLISGGEAVQIEYYENMGNERKSYQNEMRIKSPIAVHPSMLNTIDKLKTPIARYFGFISPEMVKTVDKMDAFEKERYEFLLKQITIQGLKLTGIDESLNLEIYFTKECVGGKKVSISSPKISVAFDDIFTEDEEHFDVIVSEINIEAFKYCFKKHYRQGELDFEKNDEKAA